MILAVLDVNVWVSSFLNPEGAPGRVRKAVLEVRFIPCVSPSILADLDEVITRPNVARYMKLKKNQIDEFFRELRNSRVLIGDPPVEAVVLADPDDDIIIATAVHSNAHYIVSGDKHLLDLVEYHGIRIVTPRQFLAILDAS